MKIKNLGIFFTLTAGVSLAHGGQVNSPTMNGKLKVTTLAPAEACYTGKPFSKAMGTYVFNARNYDPATSRWTSPDPCGFPDGANNRVYAPIPTVQMDPSGYFAVSTTSASSTNNLNNTADEHVGGVHYQVTTDAPVALGVIDAAALATANAGVDPAKYTFVAAGGAIGGVGANAPTMDIAVYNALTFTDNTIGLRLTGEFKNYTAVTGQTMKWLQIVTTNVSIVATLKSPYIDQYSADGTLSRTAPFYPSLVPFYTDRPARQPADVTTNGDFKWSASLYLVSVAADGKTVTVYDGMKFGYTVSIIE